MFQRKQRNAHQYKPKTFIPKPQNQNSGSNDVGSGAKPCNLSGNFVQKKEEKTHSSKGALESNAWKK